MLIVMVGLPGSGKTAWAEANFRHIVSPDRVRLEEFGTAFDPAVEANVWRVTRARVREHLARDEVVCFDATSVTAKRRAVPIRLARQARKPVVAVWTRVPEDVAWERNRTRPRPVPRAAFRRMARAFQAPTVDEGFDAVLVIERVARVPGSDTETA